MAAQNTNVRILRGLIRELRHISGKKPVKEMPAYNYILEQFRTHQVTSERICKGHNDVQHLGLTYLSYLTNVRKNQELLSQYKGRGERSVEDSARLVGLTSAKPYEAPEAPVDK